MEWGLPDEQNKMEIESNLGRHNRRHWIQNICAAESFMRSRELEKFPIFIQKGMRKCNANYSTSHSISAIHVNASLYDDTNVQRTISIFNDSTVVCSSTTTTLVKIIYLIIIYLKELAASFRNKNKVFYNFILFRESPTNCGDTEFIALKNGNCTQTNTSIYIQLKLLRFPCELLKSTKT